MSCFESSNIIGSVVCFSRSDFANSLNVVPSNDHNVDYNARPVPIHSSASMDITHNLHAASPCYEQYWSVSWGDSYSTLHHTDQLICLWFHHTISAMFTQSEFVNHYRYDFAMFDDPHAPCIALLLIWYIQYNWCWSTYHICDMLITVRQMGGHTTVWRIMTYNTTTTNLCLNCRKTWFLYSGRKWEYYGLWFFQLWALLYIIDI